MLRQRMNGPALATHLYSMTGLAQAQGGSKPQDTASLEYLILQIEY